MPASRTTRKTLRRGVAAAAALPLLIGALASCGYGSQADGKGDRKADVAATGGKKLSASEVRIGYFPNLTHATALVGIQEGLIQKELGGTAVKPQTFNAGPSEIEALNGGSLDIGFIGPSPSINGYVKSKGSNL
ncbi:ABC transporter substrate-binding protein, partial [Streptomyces sp. A0592]|uniref:ABC transporter substrate-binding protein n=1 Tax=Streptomyces sp. A0592 TaxID=2563099 RepID=UPI001135B477